MIPDSPEALPKIIWMLWLQGINQAPDLVQKCVRSWQRHNPDWKIIVLDEHSLKSFVNLDEICHRNRRVISEQAMADIVRINLLAKCGGVWADATCYCCQPLAGWLPGRLTSGFFAFRNPGPDRLLSNWFMASQKNCHLTETICRLVNAYWSQNHFTFQNYSWGQKIIQQLDQQLNRSAYRASWWVHPVIVKTLRLHPYYWFHYLFYRCVHTDPRSGEIWSRTPVSTTDLPHRLKHAGLMNPATDEIKAMIDSRQSPLFKLDWRNAGNLKPGSVLEYLWRVEQATEV